MDNFVKLQRTTSDNLDFLKLVSFLDQDLAKRNGETNAFFAQYNTVDFIKNIVILYLNQQPVACGAFKIYDDTTVEIKRMFVRKENRGKGFSTLLLNELEDWANELGYQKSVLETGDKMIEAIGLYKKCNYLIIPNYGPYKNVATSICFEKILEKSFVRPVL